MVEFPNPYGFFGPSMIDLWKANKKTDAVIGGTLAAIQGATDIINQGVNLGSIADTSGIQGQIDSIGQIGNNQYGSFEQLNAGYNQLAMSPIDITTREIRGKSDGEIGGGIISSALSGASAGRTVGGPWGALAGGIAGLGSGIVGAITGNRKAKDEKARLDIQARQSMDSAQRNLAMANENLMDYNFRSGVSRRADLGGRIERPRMSIQEFADKVLKRSKENDVSRSVQIQSRHGEGGTIVRLKL